MSTNGLVGIPISVLFTGCTLFLDVGVDRATQPTDSATGYHVSLGAAITLDNRHRGAIGVAAVRRVDNAGLPAKSYRSDGWELRGDYNLGPRWRLTAFGRHAGAERITFDDATQSVGEGGTVWSLGGGLTRYWPSMIGVLSVTAGPAYQTADLGSGGDGSSLGAAVRVSYNFDAPLIVWGMCGAACQKSLERSNATSTSSSGGTSGTTTSTKRGQTCYFTTVYDHRGNPRVVEKCP